MPTIYNFPKECQYQQTDKKPSVIVTCSGCRKNQNRVEIPEKGCPNIIQCSFCEHKMIIFGFGENKKGAYVEPLKDQPRINYFLKHYGGMDSVSNNFCFEIIKTLKDCYPE